MPRRQTLRENSSVRMEHFSVSESVKSVVTSTPLSGGDCGFTSLRLKSPEFLSPSIIASPNWIPGNEAVFKTPRSPSPVKTRRRTTMIRTEIMSKERDTPVWRQSIAGDVPHDFKVPSLMFISPPGVKTRSRRSSMFVSSQPEKITKAKGKLTASKGFVAQKQAGGVKRAGRTTRKNVTNITSEKLALSEITIDILDEKGSSVAVNPQTKKANQRKGYTRSKRSVKSESTSLNTEKQENQNNVTSPIRNDISKTPSRKRKIVCPVQGIDNDKEMKKKTAEVEKTSFMFQQNESGTKDLMSAKQNESPIKSAVKAKASPAKKKKTSSDKKGKASPIREKKPSPGRNAVKSTPARNAVKSTPARSAKKSSTSVVEQKATSAVKKSPARSAKKSSPNRNAAKSSPARNAKKSSTIKSAAKSSPAKDAIKNSLYETAMKSSSTVEQKASPARSAVKNSLYETAMKSSSTVEQKASPARSAVKNSLYETAMKSSSTVEQKASPARSAVKNSLYETAMKSVSAVEQNASPARSAVKNSLYETAMKSSSAVEQKASPARSAVKNSLYEIAMKNSLSRKEMASSARNEQISFDRKVEIAVSGMKENETRKWNETTSSARAEKLLPSVALETPSLTSGMSLSRQATVTMNRNMISQSSPSRSMKRASWSAHTEEASPAGKIRRAATFRDVGESDDFEETNVEEEQSSTDNLNMTLSHTTHSSRCTIL